MRLAEAAEPTFARHETFHPRYGWFRKAYAFSARDPHTFTREDAPVVIGVGKNMVRSIRFWGLAAKLVVEDPMALNRRDPGVVPTELGHALFGSDGWDPYMEDPGTLWLLHWLLLAPRSRLPVWWLAFNEFNAVEFSLQDLDDAVSTALKATSEWEAPHPSSIKKDISALLRTYAPVERVGRMVLDDVLDCPMRELRLIGRSDATGAFRFALGRKATLPPAVVAYAVLDYIARTDATANTMTLGRLVQDPGTPGRAFRLNEREMHTALEEACRDTRGLQLFAPTGATQLTWKGDPGELAGRILAKYFGRQPSGFCAGPRGDRPIDDDLLDELGLGREPSDTMRRLLATSEVAV